MKKDNTTAETTDEPKPDELKDEELEKAAGGAAPPCITITPGLGGGVTFTECSGDGSEPPPLVTVDGTIITRG